MSIGEEVSCSPTRSEELSGGTARILAGVLEAFGKGRFEGFICKDADPLNTTCPVQAIPTQSKQTEVPRLLSASCHRIWICPNYKRPVWLSFSHNHDLMHCFTCDGQSLAGRINSNCTQSEFSPRRLQRNGLRFTVSNPPFESSDSASRGNVEVTFVVPVQPSEDEERTIVRPREDSTSERAARKSDIVTAPVDVDERSSPQAIHPEELSNAPRIVTFQSARGIVPLTGIERLQHIATQLKEIDAPGILSIQSVEETSDGCRVTMSPVAGATLEQLLRTRRPSWLEALRIITQVADALVPVHKKGLAHGSLQSSRIFLRNEQLTKLADFAICLVSDELSPSADHNAFACVAPENVDALRFPLTPQMDVYGVGVLLYRLICGRYPFRSDDRNEIQRQIREDAPQPPRQLAPEIPRELEQLCLQCLAKMPTDRPASAQELSTALNRLLVNYEQRNDSIQSESDSLTASQRIRVSRPASVRRVMLIQPDPPDGLVLDTLATTLDQIGFQPEPWSGDGLLYSLPTTSPNSDWTVSFCDRVLRCLRSIAKCQKTADTSPDRRSTSVRIRAISARLQSRPDVDQPVSPDALDREVLQLEATISSGSVEVCGRGCELLTRSLHCEESKFETDSPETGQYQFADRDGGTLQIHASRVRSQLPLSGRNSQFAILKSRWDQTCEGMGQIVLLIGDEGMGKTRLVRELVSHATENSSTIARTIVWNCQPYQQGQSLHPLMHWLRHSHQDFGDLDEDSTITSRIDTLLESAETSISEPACVLGSELGVRDSSYRLRSSLSATQQREQSCRVLIDWLKGQAKESPLLLVVEDLQWVDPATLSFLTLLAEGEFSDRIMTVLTFRSDFETPWGSRAHQTQVALNRLTKRHAKTMIEAASGREDSSPELVENVLKRTDGVPLYIEAEVTNPASDLFRDMRS